MADRLPIYRLESEGADRARVFEMSQKLFGIYEGFTLIFGDRGDLIGYSAFWRRTLDPFEAKVIVDSWFRTAKEIQPSTNGFATPDGPTVWVGAMWVGGQGVNPANDHAWDFGSVSADPSNPTFQACMWKVC